MRLAVQDFLSCLFGSEPDAGGVAARGLFLSCLFGSELHFTAQTILIVKEKSTLWRLSPFFQHDRQVIDLSS